MNSEEQAKRREDWIDVAKGLAIMMVTVFHADMVLGWADVDTGQSTELHKFLLPFRMPLFFLVSGFFASSAIAGTWGLLWRRRLEGYIWLFVLWSAILWIFAKLLPFSYDPTFGKEALDLVKILVRPTAFIWFLWCLALFYIVSKAVRWIDKRIVLVGFVALSLLGFTLRQLDVQHGLLGFFLGSLAYVNALTYLVFFWVGSQFRDTISSAIPTTAIRCVLVVLCFLTTTFLSTALDLPMVANSVLKLLSACAGALLLMSVAKGSTRFAPWLAKKLRDVGARTVPLYVLQIPVMWVLVTPLKDAGASVDDYGSLIHIMLALITVYAVKLMDNLAARLKLTWLFASPRLQPSGRTSKCTKADSNRETGE